MPSPNLGFIQGSYTSDGAARSINLPFRPTRFELFNETNFDSVANPGVTKRAYWFTGMAADSAFTIRNTNGAATDQSDIITANGFTFVDPSTLGSPLADTNITGATAATPVAVTMAANHGLATGDYVRIINSTAMLQITNFVWQVTYTGATTFTITAPGAGFAAAATGGTVRRVYPHEIQPELVYIQGITAAANAVVTTTFDHGYAVNDTVTIHVPNGWGMTEINGIRGRITAVTANTFTTDINSVGFTAFAFPTSAAFAAGLGVPHAINVGIQRSNLLTDAVENQSNYYMRLGTTVVGANNDVVYWVAHSAEENNTTI
jgi:hypothetical protein